jgi:DNA polymerase I-like protein with 3'-5' exonuclease and polymerase domains
MDLAVIDFETDPIVGNPIVTPPFPRGCSILMPGCDPVYYSWGSPHNDNNISFDSFHQYLTRIRDSRMPMLFHNASFDLSVWNKYFCNAVFQHGMEDNWDLIHDTQFLIFLYDPYSPSFSLKPSADRILGMSPEEQDRLFDWIVANVPECTSRKEAGAHICKAPFELVAPYAIGDVVRTRNLFEYLHPIIVEKGMEVAYDRERRLLPILMDGTKRGIRVNRSSLYDDLSLYEDCAKQADNQLSSIFGGDAWMASDESLADALENCGAVKEWVMTPKSGKRSMAKDNIRIVIPEVKVLMDYRSNLATCLQTFMRPWLAYSETDGRLHPNWNSVRQARNDYATKGARTGRLSCDSPNFQNVPTEFTDSRGNPLPVPPGLSALPLLRRYCLPEEGHLWVKRDFSSQEIRILAHFEDGALCEAYRADPLMDPHAMAANLIEGIIGILYARPTIKTTGFSIIYGTGGPGLAGQLGCSIDEARGIKSAYLSAMPGIRDLMYDVQARGKRGEAIRTWGGRLYIAEPSKVINGAYRDFAYKLLNYLIQGSAADQTKESIIDWNNGRSWRNEFLATVHDEINISTPEEEVARAMRTLRLSMDKDRFDVPMRSEGFVGENWQDIKEWNDETSSTTSTN